MAVHQCNSTRFNLISYEVKFMHSLRAHLTKTDSQNYTIKENRITKNETLFFQPVSVCKRTKASEREPFEPIKTFPKPNFMYYVLRISTVHEWEENEKKGDPNEFHFKRFPGKKVREREKRREEKRE